MNLENLQNHTVNRKSQVSSKAADHTPDSLTDLLKDLSGKAGCHTAPAVRVMRFNLPGRLAS